MSALAATVLATAACNSRVYLGAIGDGAASLLWSSTFEPGDLSEWTGDGQGGAYRQNVDTGPQVTTEVSHGGRYAAKATVSPNLGMASEAYLFRVAPSPPEAYYSAWFYIPPSLTVKSWLSLIHFNGSTTGDGRNVFPTWDVNLFTLADGNLAAHLYNFVTQTNFEETTPQPVPLGRWVHFEVLLRKAADATGRVAVWQDGAPILSLDGVATVSNDWVEWEVGGASDDVAPTPAAVYVDDASISLSRD